MPQKLTTMRIRPESVKRLRDGEKAYKARHKVKPNHSEALEMAAAAWIRELSTPEANLTQRAANTTGEKQ